MASGFALRSTAPAFPAGMTRYHLCRAHITPVCFSIDLLGYSVFQDHRRLRNDNAHRFIRKLRRIALGYAQERLMWDDIDPSVQSWIGHAKQADTLGLRKKIFSGIVFQRGRT